MTIPPPACVRYNDWRQLDVPSRDTFRPSRPVSVIVSYYEAPEALALTLAALEGQSWPRDLFEVVIVDDGSRVPLQRPRSTPLNVEVVHQEDRGFGLARARNTGVRVASHDILLFLDGDMLPEAGWIAAHARWHHAASGILTAGFRAHVAVEDVGAATIRGRSGTLKDLFAGRPADGSGVEAHMARTRELTSRDDDPFRAVVGANFGMGRDLYELVGGHDESFSRWGAEEREFAYRVFTRGGVIVPVRDAFAWHQGRIGADRDRKLRSLGRQRPKIAHLIAHAAYRDSKPGRTFLVPQFVVTIETADVAADRIAQTTETVLADPVHDLLVRIELPEGDHRLAFLEDQFGPDPRVRVRPLASALDEFPATPFHVAVRAGVAFAPGIVHRLRRELGSAVSATAFLSDRFTVSITRAWALHRARRTGRSATDFGDAIAVAPRTLRTGNHPVRDFLRYSLRAKRVVVGRTLLVRAFTRALRFLNRLRGAAGLRPAPSARSRHD